MIPALTFLCNLLADEILYPGCSITAEAWHPAGRPDGAQPDLSDTFHFLYEDIESYLKEEKRNFNELVQKKRILYSIEKVQAIA